MTATLRILEPTPGIFAYYDGRIAGKRLHSENENWLDDGAYSLGIASYAIAAGDYALVYDTHMSLAHAKVIRTHLEGLGVTRIEVVLSHWHTDHIAGNAIFSDCPIIANALTAEALQKNQALLETGDPPIYPLVHPTRVFLGATSLQVGDRQVQLLPVNIHSADGLVLWLEAEGLLLAGDTLEDTVTYVSEARHIPQHIAELERMAQLPIRRILPNHGCPEIIASGGYHNSLVPANGRYLARLLQRIDEPELNRERLRDFVAEELAERAITYFEPYEEVHRRNIEAVRQTR